jgi:hypothetical protein
MTTLSNTALRLLCRLYEEQTYTTEIKNGTPGLQELIDSDLIRRHPEILGSRMSYYRTETGVKAWETLHI